MNPGSIVLVDTNVIIEAHRTGCWKPIAQYFELHTVSKVIEETQTGYQNRSEESQIDEADLRSTFSVIVDVTETERVSFNISHDHPSLDDGEKDLLIYAESLSAPAWLLNSPDMAAVRFSHQQGWTDRLVSLEAMTSHIKARLKEDLRLNYTERWLSEKKTKLHLGM